MGTDPEEIETLETGETLERNQEAFFVQTNKTLTIRYEGQRRLGAWMIANKMTAQIVAELLKVAKKSLYRYLNEGYRPCYEVQQRMVELTNGVVSLESWLTEKERETIEKQLGLLPEYLNRIKSGNRKKTPVRWDAVSLRNYLIRSTLKKKRARR